MLALQFYLPTDFSLHFSLNLRQLPLILRCVIPVVLSNNKNKLNGIYVYSQKHNYIPYSTFTINRVQLHVSPINVGHLQVVHEALNDRLYLHVSGGGGIYIFVGWGGCEISFCVCRRGVDRVCLGGVVKVSFMSLNNHIYK